MDSTEEREEKQGKPFNYITSFLTTQYILYRTILDIYYIMLCFFLYFLFTFQYVQRGLKKKLGHLGPN